MKIFYIMACEECDHCKEIIRQFWWCAQSERKVPDIHEIAEFCELEDAKKRLDREAVMLRWDSWRKYIADGGKGSWPRDAFESLLDYLEDASEKE